MSKIKNAIWDSIENGEDITGIENEKTEEDK